ncbi:MAG: AAA family ATPase, partial [Solirubrobacterales bacterium]
MLHGRELEVARVNALIDEARAARGGALVVLGDAGVGKTTLLDVTSDAAGLRTLR